jgi:hypothetical protein
MQGPPPDYPCPFVDWPLFPECRARRWTSEGLKAHLQRHLVEAETAAELTRWWVKALEQAERSQGEADGRKR